MTKTYGEIFHGLRIERRWTIAMVSDKTGLTPMFISHVENNKIPYADLISDYLHHIVILCNCYRITLSQLDLKLWSNDSKEELHEKC